MKQHLMLVRHGETVGNKDQIAHGQTESPLSHRGVAQARCTAQMLQNWQPTYQRVYTSPLSRAQDTGRYISEALELPMHVHDGLQEAFLGKLEGVSYAQLGEFDYARRSMQDDDFNDHQGESPNQLAQRITSAIQDLRNLHANENIIVVSHGAAISHALASLLATKPLFGARYLMHNSAVTEIVFEPDVRLMHLNIHDHLTELMANEPFSEPTDTARKT